MRSVLRDSIFTGDTQRQLNSWRKSICTEGSPFLVHRYFDCQFISKLWLPASSYLCSWWLLYLQVWFNEISCMYAPEQNLLLHTEQNQHKLKQSLLLPQFYTQQNCYSTISPFIQIYLPCVQELITHMKSTSLWHRGSDATEQDVRLTILPHTQDFILHSALCT